MPRLLFSAIGILAVSLASCADYRATALRTNNGIPIYQPTGRPVLISPVPC